LPPFISVESENTGDNENLSETEALANLSVLHDAGYRRFKLISQYDFTSEIYSDIAAFSQRLLQRILNSAVNGKLRGAFAKSLIYKDWLFRKRRYQFPKDSSGPWGEGTPGRWLSFEQAKAVPPVDLRLERNPA
jgi:hypothetical protein